MDPGNPPTDSGLLEWIFKPVEPRSKKETTELSCSRRILNFIINVAVSFCKGFFVLLACALNIGNLVFGFWLGEFLFVKLVNFGADNVWYTSLWNIFSMIIACMVACMSFLFIPGLVFSIVALGLKLEEKYKTIQDKVSCQCDHSRSCLQCETKLEKEAEAETMKKAEHKVTMDELPPTYKDCFGKEEEALPGYTAVMAAVTDVTATMEKNKEALPGYTAVMAAVTDVTAAMEKNKEILPGYTAGMAAVTDVTAAPEKNKEALPGYTAGMAAVTDVTAALEKNKEALPGYTAVRAAVTDVTAAMEKNEEAHPGYTAVIAAVTDVTALTDVMKKKEQACPNYTAVMSALV